MPSQESFSYAGLLPDQLAMKLTEVSVLDTKSVEFKPDRTIKIILAMLLNVIQGVLVFAERSELFGDGPTQNASFVAIIRQGKKPF